MLKAAIAAPVEVAAAKPKKSAHISQTVPFANIV